MHELNPVRTFRACSTKACRSLKGLCKLVAGMRSTTPATWPKKQSSQEVKRAHVLLLTCYLLTLYYHYPCIATCSCSISELVLLYVEYK